MDWSCLRKDLSPSLPTNGCNHYAMSPIWHKPVMLDRVHWNADFYRSTRLSHLTDEAK